MTQRNFITHCRSCLQRNGDVAQWQSSGGMILERGFESLHLHSTLLCLLAHFFCFLRVLRAPADSPTQRSRKPCSAGDPHHCCLPRSCTTLDSYNADAKDCHGRGLSPSLTEGSKHRFWRTKESDSNSSSIAASQEKFQYSICWSKIEFYGVLVWGSSRNSAVHCILLRSSSVPQM